MTYLYFPLLRFLFIITLANIEGKYENGYSKERDKFRPIGGEQAINTHSNYQTVNSQFIESQFII